MAVNRLWSIFDVLTLHAQKFANLLKALHDLDSITSKGAFNEKGKKQVETIKGKLMARCSEMGLPVSQRLCENIGSAKNFEDLAAKAKSIREVILTELGQRVYYASVEAYTKYFKNEQPFGASVFAAFPSAAEDSFEAGNCLALERSTACVMHLMRVIEVGLTVLAKELGVQQQNDWGAYIRKIESELDARYQASKARSADEQFFSAAATNFDRICRAWRNPTMHVASVYTQEHAEEIFLAVKSFMSHLATKLSETP